MVEPNEGDVTPETPREQIRREFSVKLLLGSLGSITLLGLIVLDAVSPYELNPSTVYLLAGFIWAFLGADVLVKAHKRR